MKYIVMLLVIALTLVLASLLGDRQEEPDPGVALESELDLTGDDLTKTQTYDIYCKHTGDKFGELTIRVRKLETIEDGVSVAYYELDGNVGFTVTNPKYKTRPPIREREPVPANRKERGRIFLPNHDFDTPQLGNPEGNKWFTVASSIVDDNGFTPDDWWSAPANTSSIRWVVYYSNSHSNFSIDSGGYADFFEGSTR